jgi:phage terminase large subunit
MEETQEIIIPYNFTPRQYQLPMMAALDRGKLRLVAVWHRRAGKDKTLINVVVNKMVERVGTYFYFFPTYNQGRKILWQGMDRSGFKFMHHIPGELIRRVDNTQMLVELTNGSILQIVGTDNIDSIVGTNPVGCVFSEYSLQNPRAWDYIRPILAENGGWAIFNYTPRGNNHGKALFEMAQKDPENWFCQKLTVDDTKVIPQKVLDQERQEIVAKDGNDALFQQEYYCSFDVPIQGAYYGTQLLLAEKEKRITNVPYEQSLPVNTYWDLGVGDSTAIWFEQTVGMEVRIIDYYETNGEGLAHYVKVLKEKPYVYGDHYAPFDINVTELGSGKTRLHTAQELGINFRIVPRVAPDDGIDKARMLLGRCWFDKTKTERGLDALKSYHKEWDEENKTYKNRPNHDWASHGADAFRYLAVAYERDRTVEDLPDDTAKFRTGYY